MKKFPFFIACVIALVVLAVVKASSVDNDSISLDVNQASVRANIDSLAAQAAQEEEICYAVEPSEYDDSENDYSYWRVTDTLGIYQGKAFGIFREDGQFVTFVWGNTPVVSDNTCEYDSVSPNKVKLSILGGKSAVFDFKDPVLFHKLCQFDGPIDGFERFDSVYKLPLIPDTSYYVYSLVLDYPSDETPHCEDIMDWLVQMVNCTVQLDNDYNPFTVTSGEKTLTERYTGKKNDVEALGRYVSTACYMGIRDLEDANYFDVMTEADFRVRQLNDKYVTFCGYFHDMMSIGHGLMTCRYYTYDLDSKKLVTKKYLFRPGTEKKVQDVLIDVISNDERYCSSVPRENVRIAMGDWAKPGVLPEPGLLPEGIVFSYQPYDIDCFASGIYHFVVPYDRLMPYLTPEAKRLVHSS